MNNFRSTLFGVAILGLVLVTWLSLSWQQRAAKEDMQLLVSSITNVQTSFSGLHERLDQALRQFVDTNDRVSAEIAREFENDKRFLSEVVSLKKDRTLAKLRKEIAAYQDKDSTGDPSVLDPYTQQLNESLSSAADFSVFAINGASKTALLKVRGQAQEVGVGEVVGGFFVKEIDVDQVVLVGTDDQEYVLKLVYGFGDTQPQQSSQQGEG